MGRKWVVTPKMRRFSRNEKPLKRCNFKGLWLRGKDLNQRPPAQTRASPAKYCKISVSRNHRSKMNAIHYFIIVNHLQSLSTIRNVLR